MLHRAWRDWSAAWIPASPPTHASILVLPQQPILQAADAATLLVGFCAATADLTNGFVRFDVASGWEEDHL